MPASIKITKCFVLDRLGPLTAFRGGSENHWTLTQEAFAEHCGCEPDDIDGLETDDCDCSTITARGEIVGSTLTTWRSVQTGDRLDAALERPFGRAA